MLDKLFSEKVTAALVLALAGAILARVANGPGSLSPERIVRGALSNPVPRRQPQTTRKENKGGKQE